MSSQTILMKARGRITDEHNIAPGSDVLPGHLLELVSDGAGEDLIAVRKLESVNYASSGIVLVALEDQARGLGVNDGLVDRVTVYPGMPGEVLLMRHNFLGPAVGPGDYVAAGQDGAEGEVVKFDPAASTDIRPVGYVGEDLSLAPDGLIPVHLT